MDYVVRDRAGSPILDRAGDIIYLRGYIPSTFTTPEHVDEHFWCIINKNNTNISVNSFFNNWTFGKRN